MPHDRIVGRYQAEGSERSRHQPVPIRSAQAQRARPNRFLVQRQIPRQMNYAEAGNLVRSRCSKSSMSTLCWRRNRRSTVALPLDFFAACSHLQGVSISILIFIFVIYIFVRWFFVISLFVVFVFVFVVDFHRGSWDRGGFQNIVGSMFSLFTDTLNNSSYAALCDLLSLPWPVAFEIGSPGGTDGCGEQ